MSGGRYGIGMYNMYTLWDTLRDTLRDTLHIVYCIMSNMTCIRCTPYMPPYIHSLLDSFRFIEDSDTLIDSRDMRFVVSGGVCGTIL